MHRITFISLIYGALAGAIVIGTTILGGVFGDGEGVSSATMEWLGYLIMLIALSVIFVGVKRYRDEHLGGVIRFGTALLVGLGISVVAAVVYVVGWEAYLASTDHAFIDDYTQQVVEAKEASGASAAEVAETRKAMETMKLRYAKPWFRVPMTFLEIFPVGLIIALLSAAILRNPRVLPASS